MKKILLPIIVLIFAMASAVSAQQENRTRCSTDEHTQWLLSQDPGLASRMASVEEQMDKWIAEHGNDFASRTSATTIIIPTVVHVVWYTAVQNISDDLVKSQMDVLNEDFGGYNADAVKIPPFFRDRKAGDQGIRFQLAVRDPSGNATNGIDRVQTFNSTGFSQNDNVKHASTQGADAWPCGDYMNIWVCNFSAASQLIGYAQFPGGNCATDGVVIQYNTFGRVSSYPAYNLGRTTTHEFSHCFNLRHIWGDANCGNDFCGDTPTQQQANFGAPACHAFTCNNQPTGDMYMNYMDYSDDVVLHMFTANQAARVLACINTSRVSLLSSLGCTPINAPAVDAAISDIVSPSGVPCDNTLITFIPEVVLKNYGSTPLTSATINYKIDAAGATMTQAWTGNLATGTTTNITLPSMTSTTGDHIFYSWTSSPNGTVDGTPANDKQQRNFIGHAANVAYPISQGFESLPFPPTGWSNKNYDCGIGWVRSTTVSHSGTACAYFNNFSATATQNGVMDEIYTQTIDMTNAPSNAILTFWKAYAEKSLTSFDTLEVLASTDCGYNYTSILKEWALTLATAPATTSAFVPAAADWAQVTVSLAPFVGQKNLILDFRNINHGGNNLYIDDLNVTVVGINEILPGATVNVYPNPTEGLFNVSAKFENPENMQITVTDALGQAIYKSVPKTTISELTTIDLRNKAKGIYFVQLRTDKGSVVKKVSLSN